MPVRSVGGEVVAVGDDGESLPAMGGNVLPRLQGWLVPGAVSPLGVVVLLVLIALGLQLAADRGPRGHPPAPIAPMLLGSDPFEVVSDVVRAVIAAQLATLIEYGLLDLGWGVVRAVPGPLRPGPPVSFFGDPFLVPVGGTTRDVVDRTPSFEVAIERWARRRRSDHCDESD